MSYEKVRQIQITEDKVFINCASNNCRPLTYTKEEYPYFTKILLEKGKEGVEIEILREYESGNLQEGKNKYTRALMVLQHLEEYKPFNWRNEGDAYEKAKELRQTPAFTELLRKVLNTKLPKEKFVLSKDSDRGICYLHKVTTRRAFWIGDKEKAKTFNYEQDAERVKTYFRDSENWKVERLVK